MAIITTHLCLVSKQATPNLTPLLDRKFQPDTVVLLVSPDMHQQAGWLEEHVYHVLRKILSKTISKKFRICKEVSKFIMFPVAVIMNWMSFFVIGSASNSLCKYKEQMISEKNLSQLFRNQ